MAPARTAPRRGTGRPRRLLRRPRARRRVREAAVRAADPAVPRPVLELQGPGRVGRPLPRLRRPRPHGSRGPAPLSGMRLPRDQAARARRPARPGGGPRLLGRRQQPHRRPAPPAQRAAHRGRRFTFRSCPHRGNRLSTAGRRPAPRLPRNPARPAQHPVAAGLRRRGAGHRPDHLAGGRARVREPGRRGRAAGRRQRPAARGRRRPRPLHALPDRGPRPHPAGLPRDAAQPVVLRLSKPHNDRKRRPSVGRRPPLLLPVRGRRRRDPRSDDRSTSWSAAWS